MLPRNALRILKAFHEASQWQGSGEAVLRSGEYTGRVFFANGKIAWATASTLKRTFTAFMVEEAHLDEESLKEAFADCKRTGKNFGETLVEWGLLDEPTLRRLLLQQIAEAVLEMFAWPELASLFMPENRTYKGSLTYEVGEVLGRVLELDTAGRVPFHSLSAAEILAEASRCPPEALKSSPPVPAAVAEQPRRSRAWLAAAIAGLALVAVAGALVAAGGAAVDGPDAAAPPAKSPDASLAAGRDAAIAPDAARAAPAAGPDAGAPDAAPTPDAGPRTFPPGIVANAEGDGEGFLRIASVPSKATIYIDGLGTARTTPYVFGRIPSGRDHLVIVEREGLPPAYAQAEVRKGRITDVKLTLRKGGKPWSGRVVVRVESEPEGASVVLDGDPIKQPTPVSISLPASKASRLVLMREGHEPWVRTVRAVPSVKLTIFAKLKKSAKPGR